MTGVCGLIPLMARGVAHECPAWVARVTDWRDAVGACVGACVVASVSAWASTCMNGSVGGCACACAHALVSHPKQEVNAQSQ
jgi:hypothetical protein